MTKEIKKPITTTEIARLSGVSRATVSAVLNDKPGVREQTRQKVLTCIREQNYDSGIIAKTLVGEMSRMIAILAADVSNPYHATVFRGINQVLNECSYHTMFHNVRHEDEVDPETLASFKAYRPAGYIILKGAEGPDRENVKQILKEGIPLVTLEESKDADTHSVYFDAQIAMRLATDYVLSKGHVRLGLLGGPPWTGAKQRKLGFVESLIEHDIDMQSTIMVHAGETAEEGYAAALKVLADPATRPTALVCFNDMVAMGAYLAAHELDLDIPRDVSVIGFDGLSITRLLAPPLTSVSIAPAEMGREAARLLLNLLSNEKGPKTVRIAVEPKLIEGRSVRVI
jgi:DNA-binding LacI/PurR family transcriptional regulator